MGYPEIVLDYLPSLAEASVGIQYHSCFISHSQLDEAFARKLYGSLRDRGVRVWYAPEDMAGGQKLFEQIDYAIQMHDKLLVVLSDASLRSNWVQTEIRRARRQEKITGERKLFPVGLTAFQNIRAWECFDADSATDMATEIREYYIPDFSKWREDAAFQVEFGKLCRDLKKAGVKTEKRMGTNDYVVETLK